MPHVSTFKDAYKLKYMNSFLWIILNADSTISKIILSLKIYGTSEVAK